MDLTSYSSIQKQIQTYRANLHKLEDKIAAHGGYLYAPLDAQNQYDHTKEKLESLIQDLHQTERRMIREIPVIHDEFSAKEQRIEQLETELHTLRQSFTELESLNKEIISLLNKNEELSDIIQQKEDVMNRLNQDLGINHQEEETIIMLFGSLRLIENMCDEIAYFHKKAISIDHERVNDTPIYELLEGLRNEV